jgi:hypothetical protein
MIGTPSEMSGTRMATVVDPWIEEPSIEVVASTKPRNMLPESPMKIVAGLKL